MKALNGGGYEVSVPAGWKVNQRFAGAAARSGGFSFVADDSVTLGKIEVERSEEAVHAIVGNCFSMLDGEGVPPQRLLRRRLVPRDVMSGDAGLIVISVQRPSPCKQLPRRRSVAFDSHSRRAELNDWILGINNHRVGKHRVGF